MNYYENKQLQDRETKQIATGVCLILFTPLLGFISAVAIAAILGIPFAATFYPTCGAIICIGIASIAAGVKERIDRKRNQDA